jgi:hypothetical protein
MYSFSKAILNKMTQLVHQETGSICRMISVCPGNFISPMTTEGDYYMISCRCEQENHSLSINFYKFSLFIVVEEKATAVAPKFAAEQILNIAGDWNNFQGGKFYRHGKEISF